jgi:polyisoprenoid-binding protein YceI
MQTECDIALVGSWVLDPRRTTITFETKAMWILKVKGTLSAVEGHGSVAPDGSVTGSLTADMRSVNTRIAKRDSHLRSIDFFDVEHNPTMTFTLLSARVFLPRAFLNGTLEIRSCIQRVELDAAVTVSDDTLTMDVETQLDRRNWGISLAKGPGKASSMHSFIRAQATFTRI